MSGSSPQLAILDRMEARLLEAARVSPFVAKRLVAACFGLDELPRALGELQSRPDSAALLGALTEIEAAPGRHFTIGAWAQVASLAGNILMRIDPLRIPRAHVPDLLAVALGYGSYAQLQAAYEPPFVTQELDPERFAAEHRSRMGYWPLCDLLLGQTHRGHCCVLAPPDGGFFSAFANELASLPTFRRRVIVIDVNATGEGHGETAWFDNSLIVRLDAGAVLDGDSDLLVREIDVPDTGAVVLLCAGQLTIDHVAAVSFLPSFCDARRVSLVSVFRSTGEAIVLSALWKASRFRMAWCGNYREWFPGLEVGAQEAMMPGLRSFLQHHHYLRISRGDPVPFLVGESGHLPVVASYPWLLSLSPTTGAVNAQKEDVLSIEWSTASDRRLIAVRIRRHGDADSVEGTIELVEQEWRLIEDVALGHGSRPHTPAELEALLATLRALSYRVRPIRIAAVDPHSGHVDLQLTASGERLAAWLLSQPANSGAAVNSVK